MAKKKGSGQSSSGPITDARFANFATDPRFRLPSKRHTKTTIDKRFARMLKDDDFSANARVDRYGRKINTDTKKKALQRLYQEEEEEEKGDDDVEDKDEEKDREEELGDDLEIDDDELIQKELRAADANYDPARQGGYSSSSDDDSDQEDADVDAKTQDEDGGMQKLRREQATVEDGEVTKRIAIVNMDWDHVKSTDLMALFSSFLTPGGGKIEKISVYPSEFGKERMQREELEGPPKEIFRGTKDSDDQNEKGGDGDDGDNSDQLDFDTSDEDSDEEDARIRRKLIKEGDDQEFDNDALRSYQLDRLRYYYAVMICSDEKTAQKLYEMVDGKEYQSSSNFLDLRFVPDEVDFDDEPRDECDRVPDGYRPVEYITEALQSSKVKLTWDLHPEEASRKDTIRRAFTGSRSEIEENDLKAYLASDSEDDDEEDVEEVVVASDAQVEASGDGDDGKSSASAAAAANEPRLSKKELARKKMREALGLGDEPMTKASSKKGGPIGDMQITFTAALTGDDKSKAKKKPAEQETTIEKYARKERERKEKKRQLNKAKRGEVDDVEDGDKEEAGEDIVHNMIATEQQDDEAEDLGFNDPFFTNEEPAQAQSKSSQRKEDRRKKREEREAAEAESAKQRAQLEKVMGVDQQDAAAPAGDDHLDHFDMNEIVRAARLKAKAEQKQQGNNKTKTNRVKLQQQKKADEAIAKSSGLQQGFAMNVDDDRFKAVFEDHAFAIDPSNPRFKPTEAMQQLLEEGRQKKNKKRKGPAVAEDDADAAGAEVVQQRKKTKHAKAAEEQGPDLDGLVSSIKRKSNSKKK